MVQAAHTVEGHEIPALFATIGLPSLAAVFMDAGYDSLERLALFERDDFQSLSTQVKPGHAKQVLQLVAQLQADQCSGA